jgi:hypothetical protein
MNLKEGFDDNFKRIVPIDIVNDVITVPKNITNSITIPSVTTMKKVNVPQVVATKGTINRLITNKTSVGGATMEYTDRLRFNGNVLIQGNMVSQNLRANNIRLKGWSIRTDGGHLHMRRINGNGTQFAPDGNILMDNRGWMTDLLANTYKNRNDKVQVAIRAIKAAAEATARELKRAAEELARTKEAQAIANAGRNVGNAIARGLGFSDRRLKYNIEDMPSMLDKIMSMEPKVYQWKDQDGKGYGFIAQDIHKLFPDMPKIYVDKLDEEGKPYYGLDYGAFTPYIIKALQELKRENDELKVRVEKMDVKSKPKDKVKKEVKPKKKKAPKGETPYVEP